MKNKIIRQAAKETGMKWFLAPCPKHGLEEMHFTSSGRCMKCTAEAKDPVKQAKYWTTVSDQVNQKKREKYVKN
jgi:hypothetical protein